MVERRTTWTRKEKSGEKKGELGACAGVSGKKKEWFRCFKFWTSRPSDSHATLIHQPCYPNDDMGENKFYTTNLLRVS